MKKLIKSHRLSFFAIIEPKATLVIYLIFKDYLTALVAIVMIKGASGYFEKVKFKCNWSALQISVSPHLPSSVLISFVYGSCDGRERRALWHDLSD